MNVVNYNLLLILQRMSEQKMHKTLYSSAPQRQPRKSNNTTELSDLFYGYEKKSQKGYFKKMSSR